MAYHVEKNGDIVIDGLDKGIGDSPYSGLTDERNVNLISIQGEASVNFATSRISVATIATGTITSASGSVATYTGASGMEDYISIYFTSTGAYSGITLATPYWVSQNSLSTTTFALYTDYKRSSGVTFGGSGSASFTTYQTNVKPSYMTGGTGSGATGLGGIQYFAYPTNIQQSTYYTFGVDGYGQVWGNQFMTGKNNYWTYTGNKITDGAGSAGDTGASNASGNGLVYWRVDNAGVGSGLVSADYLFAFRNSQIDYMVVQSSGSGAATTGVWTYGWTPSTGSANGNNYLTVPAGTSGSHLAITSYDGRVYFCDGYNIKKLYQTAAATIFDPTTTSTFTYTNFTLLPIDDVAQCLAPLGNNMLIGGQNNAAYQWDTTSNLVSNYIPIADSFIAKIVSVNTNAFIFAGNRGRIYITNGSQAELWKKVPDHLSNSVEPRFKWGGACAIRNQLYFSFSATLNDGNTSVNTYGGVWAIDLSTQALREVNILSYGTYAGYASALAPIIYNPVAAPSITPSGSSIFIGWYDGVSFYGIDQPSSTLYSGGQAYVTSDLIPIGTLLKPTTAKQIEFKLSTPLLANESVELQQASSLANGTNPTFVSLGTTTGTGSEISGNFPIKLQNQQWILVKAILTASTVATPSFNRLTQLRIIPS